MIIVRLSGGLGNQMFQYALGRNLAIKYNTELYLDASVVNDRTFRPGFTHRSYFLDVFNIKSQLASRSDIPVVYRQFCKGRPRILIDNLRHRFLPNKGKENNVLIFQPSVLSAGPNVYLDGHWNNEKYFIENADSIRADFILKDPLGEKTLALLNQIKQNQSLCIFVRRSDFVNNDFHRTLGADYYEKAFAYINSKNKINNVYVFSDDLDWCRLNLRFSAETMFVGNEYAGKNFSEHMILMSACKNFVIANSSFAWWAVWLNQDKNKIVVAPKRWFFDKHIETDEVPPVDWVRI